MTDPKALSEVVMKTLEDYLPVADCGTFYSQHIEPVLAEALEEAEIEAHKCCTEAIGRSNAAFLVAIKHTKAEAYDRAAEAAEKHQDHHRLGCPCHKVIAERIRALKDGSNIGLKGGL